MEKIEPTPDSRCGTTAGYNAHRGRKERPCEGCSSAQREYQRNWRQENAEHIREHNVRKYENNKEEVIQKVREWRENNPEKAKEYRRLHYVKNKEKVQLSNKGYYQKNAEYLKDQSKAYYAGHKEDLRPYKREASRRRRAQKRKNGIEHYTEREILDLYGIACHICSEEIDMQATRVCGEEGWERGLHIDHVIPISKGGPDTLENVRPAHGKCNVAKGARLPESIPTEEMLRDTTLLEIVE